MSKLRPECQDSRDPATPDDTVLYLVRDSVARRKELIYGRLHDGRGRHCAMGAFWTDNPGVTVHSALLDEIATVNDSLPISASPKERWKKVDSWLRWKLKVLANPSAATPHRG